MLIKGLGGDGEDVGTARAVLYGGMWEGMWCRLAREDLRQALVGKGRREAGALRLKWCTSQGLDSEIPPAKKIPYLPGGDRDGLAVLTTQSA